MNLTYGSVCSGIESASVAWEPLGMQAKWFSEIETFPCAVLAHHWPDVVNLGDMTKLPEMVRRGKVEAPDILVGGTPCQAFSVAGKGLSLDDARGQLSLIYGDLFNAIDEKRRSAGLGESVCVWENVPGVLSTKDNAFGWFLGLLAGEYTLDDITSGTAIPLEAQPGESRQKWTKSGCIIGPVRTVAWRIIDAQYFGVAQRRRRVFVVASARKGFDPAAVLFERESMRRDSPPSREAQQEAAGNAGTGFKGSSHWDNPVNPHPTLNQSFNTGGIGASNQEIFSQRGSGIVHGFRMTAFGEYADDETAGTMKARDYKDATDLCVSVHGTQDPCTSDNLAFALGRNNGGENAITQYGVDVAVTLTARHDSSPCHDRGQNMVVPYNVSAVRRLTPTECERLQGFPDGHTLIPDSKRRKLEDDMKEYYLRNWPELTNEQLIRLVSDGPRYKAIGNSKAVPVIRRVGKRIIEQLRKTA
nr:DNA cytosine methyltransferase [uncultured Shewanella sp.]